MSVCRGLALRHVARGVVRCDARLLGVGTSGGVGGKSVFRCGVGGVRAYAGSGKDGRDEGLRGVDLEWLKGRLGEGKGEEGRGEVYGEFEVGRGCGDELG